MHVLVRQLNRSPMWARVLPFAVFVVLTGCQEVSGPVGRYWFYAVKTGVAAALLWMLRDALGEMRWQFSTAGVVTGVAVFGLWVGLEPALACLGVPHSKLLPSAQPWNPHAQFGCQSSLAWLLVGVRALGSTLVVPPLEEVFYRSFLYRYLARSDFLSVPLGQFAWGRFLACAVLFGLSHREWLEGILCGLAYQGLVVWKNRLGDAITAHSITNFLLAVWVIGQDAWHYW